MMSVPVRPAQGRRRMLATLWAMGALASPLVLQAAGDRHVQWTDVALIDGSVLRAADLQAQAVVVEIWATWCPFCMRQNPHVQKLHETAGGKGLRVLTFALDNDVELIRDYQRRHGYTFAAARITPQVERWFGTRRGLPELYVVDKRGRVVLREEGEMFPEDVAALARFAAGA
jgi:thiol-disulfide isomerase/thioredoxin